MEKVQKTEVKNFKRKRKLIYFLGKISHYKNENRCIRSRKSFGNPPEGFSIASGLLRLSVTNGNRIFRFNSLVKKKKILLFFFLKFFFFKFFFIISSFWWKLNNIKKFFKKFPSEVFLFFQLFFFFIFKTNSY